MKLEQQVVSLELAQKLKELGVKQESLFYYQVGQIYLRSQHIDPKMLIADNGERTLYMPEFDVSAYTVAELGEMLPKQYRSWKSGDDKEWICDTWASTVQRAETEADARAKMLIYLVENNLITP